ncbi:DNA replication/repair protein RecF [Balneola sp. MJW-20]|uniref:DNA replication/repair protein RecF n=1 Tax=Gracilimonas aurantiaca TaxID=3234185 RepID=UPI0034675522
MHIDHLELRNFRNHLDTKVDWVPGLNVITGPNGAGKTSLIDAIHYLCMSRSFVSNSDMYVIHQDESYFMISGQFKGNIRKEFKVSCSYSRGEGKKIFVNDSPLDRLSDLIGMVPVVVLAPDDKKLTLEGPVERRSFIDGFISQISPAYLRDLIEYRKIRKQRNTLLQEFRGPREQLEIYLEPWDMQLAEAGARIVSRRKEVLDKFSHYLENDYTLISGMDMTTRLEYQTFCNAGAEVDEIRDEYLQLLSDARDKEIEREQTTIGPHRDEIVFYLNDFELRKYGSQGQHRLFALSLKLAQLHYYSDELDDLPILMLDDVFGDLDISKIEILLNALQEHKGQTFITSANPVPFKDYVDFDGTNNKFYRVDQAEIIPA